MNDNPEGTPNPLDKSPTMDNINNNQTQAITPPNTQTMPNNNITSPVVASNNPLTPANNEISPQLETTELSKKPNKGKIAAIITCLALLICGIVAVAVILLNSNRTDAVSLAMQKIMSGNAPSNIAIDGTINILLNNEESPLKRININLDSDIAVGSMINTSSAVLTFTDKDNKDYSVKVNEVYANDSDLYFEIEGARDAIEESGLLDMLSKFNGDSESNTESDETNSQMSKAILGIIESVDGVYLRLSADELSSIKQQSLGNSSVLSCITDMVTKLEKNSSSTTQLYNKYPFVTSSSEKIPITSKQNPIYMIWVDEEKFTNYASEMKNTEIATAMYSCLGWDNNVAITKDDVAKITSKIPNIYAEINEENNFTRLYLESDINDGVATATIDLGFSYPSAVNVSEPVEYTDFSDFMQTVFTSMYGSNESAS